MEDVTESILTEVEADCFWCLTKLLENLQDSYTFSQPGIRRQVTKLQDLINRIDCKFIYKTLIFFKASLYEHLQKENVDFMQFAFRWMNCLLTREISGPNIIRMWDTYLVIIINDINSLKKMGFLYF